MFKPVVIDIQNHGRSDMTKYVLEHINEAYEEYNSKTFISSDLMRNQVGGLSELTTTGNAFGHFIQKDFSKTGAARTMALDVKMFFRHCLTTCFWDTSGYSDSSRYVR